VNGITGRDFWPVIATEARYLFDMRDSLRWYGGAIQLWRDLLSVTSITLAGRTLTSDEYVMTDAQPYQRLIIRATSGTGSSWRDALSIVGTWGYPTNEVLSGTIAIGGITDSVTTITTAATFEVFDLIKVDSEYMLVTAVTAGVSITVTRAQLGTTAAAHLAGAGIYRVFVPNDLRLAVTRLVAYLYQKRTDLGRVTTFIDGTVEITDIPKDLLTIIYGYKRINMGAV
jgi:hypothetical protein